MLTDKEMLEIAHNFIESFEQKVGEKLVLPEELIIKRPYGFYFIYHSKKYWETKDWEEKLLGNAPFLVEKETGKIIEFGTSRSMDEYIKEYEAGKFPS